MPKSSSHALQYSIRQEPSSPKVLGQNCVMSIRYYQPRRRRRNGTSPRRSAILYLLLAIALLSQISYPLLNGEALRVITLVTVFSAAVTMVIHSYLNFGPKFALRFFSITFFYSLIVEVIGTRTGWPFGNYKYSTTLGAQLFGVPLVVMFAWMMMAYPTLILARRVSRHWTFLIGGYTMMAWDFFLDPQMVAAGRWNWDFTGRHVPFQPEIPLSNAFGWLLTGMGLIALLQLSLPKDRRSSISHRFIPEFFLVWTWLGGVIANLFFFNRPGTALIGGLGLGLAIASYYTLSRIGRADD